MAKANLAKANPDMTVDQLDAFIAGLSEDQRKTFAGLSGEQQQELAKRVQSTPSTQPAEPRKVTPLDLSDGEHVTFVVDLVDDARVTDKRFLGERMLWSKGVNNAKGPKGGVYYAGVISLGHKTRTPGTMKISKQSFDALRAGKTAYAWVRLKGQTSDTLIGVMQHYRAVEAKATATV